MGGVESKQEPPKVKSFNGSIGSIPEVGAVDIYDGFDFVYVHPNQKIHGYAVHVLKMSPRQYPVFLAMQVGEAVTPGTYNCVLMGEFLDMSYRASLSLMGGSSVELTVPIDETTKTSLTASLDLSSIQGQIQVAERNYNFEGVFSSSNNFASASISSNFTYKLTNHTTIGGLFNKQLFEGGFVVRAGMINEKDKFESGTLLSYDGSLRLNKSLKYTYNDRVRGYLQLDCILSEPTAQVALGFDRDFLMTSFSATVTSAGVVNSKVTRKLGAEKQISLTAMGNLFQRIYKFGLNLTLN